MKKTCIICVAFFLSLVLCACNLQVALPDKDDNDHKPTESIHVDVNITVNTAPFTETAVEGQFHCNERVEVLEGNVSGVEHVSRITLELLDHAAQTVYVDDIEVKQQWSIPNFGLLYGYNTLVISALDEEDNVISSSKLEILNAVQENEVTLKLETLDSDSDGLTDEFEIYHTLTNPFNQDTDGNNISDASEDFDSDGLTNLDEQLYHGSPFSADTDCDQISDLIETQINTALNNSDTDNDGVNDYIEYLYELDFNGNNANTVISYAAQKEFTSGMDVSLKVDIVASAAHNISINQLPETSILMQALEGKNVGDGISFTTSTEFKRARVTINVKGKHDAGCALYYFDPDMLMLTRVSDQKYSSGTITATLDHFSEYIVMPEPQDDYISLYPLIKKYLDKQSLSEDCDSDGDGFNDQEDPSPYSAISFKSYADYLRYLYPDKDIVTLHVNYHGEFGTDAIILDGDHGHSWISYTTADGKTESAGMYADEDVVLNQTVPGQVRTTEYWYYTTDPSNKQKYTDKSAVKPEPAESEIMIPFVVNPAYYNVFKEFIQNYNKPYNLYDNNCTTFALECLDKMGIAHSYNTYNEDTQYNGPLNAFLFKHMKDSNSPGHVAYNATLYNLDKIVIMVEEKKGTPSYASDITYNMATMKDTEQVNDKIYFKSSDKINWNGHAYQIFDISMSWNEAKDYCESLGGHLATITSVEEQNALASLLATGSKKQYWIGLDTQTGWVTGEALEYTNWDAIEPNGCTRRGAKERYVHILNVANPAVHGSARLRWNDMFNDNTFPKEEANFSLHTVGILCEWEEIT